MLTRLAIRDVVLIEALDLDFSDGLGALTGETGAGKSILLDSLGLALGARADSGLVRRARWRVFSHEDPQGGRESGREQHSADQPVPPIGDDVASG